MYLANRGYKTCNIPIIPNKELPEQLLKNAEKMCTVGLVCDPRRLVEVRKNRVQFLYEDKPKDYIDEKEILGELENSKKLFKKYNWPTIDVTRKSVEETAASIIKIFDILNAR